MFHSAEIQEMIAEEIELVTQMCRGRKFMKPAEIQQVDLYTDLLYAAGKEPELEEAA